VAAGTAVTAVEVVTTQVTLLVTEEQVEELCGGLEAFADGMKEVLCEGDVAECDLEIDVSSPNCGGRRLTDAAAVAFTVDYVIEGDTAALTDTLGKLAEGDATLTAAFQEELTKALVSEGIEDIDVTKMTVSAPETVTIYEPESTDDGAGAGSGGSSDGGGGALVIVGLLLVGGLGFAAYSMNKNKS
jgi:hypothetical protein